MSILEFLGNYVMFTTIKDPKINLEIAVENTCSLCIVMGRKVGKSMILRMEIFL